MAGNENMMLTLTKKFLDEHFPNDNRRVSEGGSEIFVSVGDGEMKLFFNVCGNSIYSVSIHNDYLDEICPLFGLDTYYTDAALVLNTFTTAVNDNKRFNEVFQPIKPMDFSKYFTKSFSDGFMDFYDADTIFSLVSKVGNKEYGCIAQFSFRFTEDNTLKPISAISLFNNTVSDYRVAFNLDAQTIHVITETENIYEDFFRNNTLFNGHDNVEHCVTKFVDNVIAKFHSEKPESASPFHSDNVAFCDKLPLFEMIHI